MDSQATQGARERSTRALLRASLCIVAARPCRGLAPLCLYFLPYHCLLASKDQACSLVHAR